MGIAITGIILLVSRQQIKKSADQTAHCAFVVFIWHKQVFSWLGLYATVDEKMMMMMSLCLVAAVKIDTA